ncbi:NtaA/DmoA family FMN-dependent monooxygenase [Saccharothrix australiensis]|nr:NtaA/DmoA family FMN-dependent monooxygenase [Saccharothrix australiensis]
MFPGTNSTLVWSDPATGSHIDFAAFADFARTAERARFDFVFLAEGLRLREQQGKVYDRDMAGRPDNFAVLAALAAVTDRIGLAGTVNSTFNEPFEVARQFATLDHLSGGRAGWNVVTTWEEYVGENFRRGSYLPREQRYERAAAFLDAVCRLLGSWRADDVLADKATGRFLRRADAGAFAHRDAQFDIAGRFTTPPGPQGRPVVFQAGSSPEGREFAAAAADAIFGMYGDLAEKREFYADVRRRAAAHGRAPGTPLVLPAATFCLGDTDAEARERAARVRLAQVDGRTAIAFLEEVWNRDLGAYDPDGPLPDVEPVVGGGAVAKAMAGVRKYPDPPATARRWRELAEAKGLSIRELVIEVTGRQTFIGAPSTVADAMCAWVDGGACDGFIVVPHTVPGAFDEFARTVVPLLQERGVVRAEYEGRTLREHLGLACN